MYHISESTNKNTELLYLGPEIAILPKFRYDQRADSNGHKPDNCVMRLISMRVLCREWMEDQSPKPTICIIASLKESNKSINGRARSPILINTIPNTEYMNEAVKKAEAQA